MSAYVSRRLTETFLSDSVIDLSLELCRLRIRTSLNEVWLLTPARELGHTWDSVSGSRGAGDKGVGMVWWWGSDWGCLRLLGKDVLILGLVFFITKSRVSGRDLCEDWPRPLLAKPRIPPIVF